MKRNILTHILSFLLGIVALAVSLEYYARKTRGY